MQYMVDDQRVKRACKKCRKQPVARRVLAAAACLLLAAAITVMTVPSARAAVTDWISKYFSAGDYLGEGRDARVPEPAMDAIITGVGSGERTVTVRNVYDSDQARAMAANFGVKLDEVAYTGSEVYITGWLTGGSGKFLLDHYTGGDTWHNGGEYTEGSMWLTLPDGTEYHGTVNAHITDEINAVMAQAVDVNNEKPRKMVYDENGNLVTSNARADALWKEYLNTNDVRFIFETASAWNDASALSGQVTAKLSFRQYYWDVESEQVIDLFYADLGEVVIDTDAYAAVTSQK